MPILKAGHALHFEVIHIYLSKKHGFFEVRKDKLAAKKCGSRGTVSLFNYLVFIITIYSGDFYVLRQWPYPSPGFTLPHPSMFHWFFFSLCEGICDCIIHFTASIEMVEKKKQKTIRICKRFEKKIGNATNKKNERSNINNSHWTKRIELLIPNKNETNDPS